MRLAAPADSASSGRARPRPAAANIVGRHARRSAIRSARASSSICEKSPDYGILRLANPYRLVIDLPDVDFKDPAEPGEGRGPDQRLSLRLDRAGQGAHRARSLRAGRGGEHLRARSGRAPSRRASSSTSCRRRRRPSRRPSASDRPTRMTRRPRRRAGGPVASQGLPVVVIDPGHGGIDSGARGQGRAAGKGRNAEIRAGARAAAARRAASSSRS